MEVIAFFAKALYWWIIIVVGIPMLLALGAMLIGPWAMLRERVPNIGDWANLIVVMVLSAIVWFG